MKREKRKRTEPIKFRVYESEKKIIDEKAKRLGLDRSKYLRKVSLQEPLIIIDMSKIDKLIYEVNKIGVNINQIAKYANGHNVLYKNDIKEIKESLNSIWEKIYEIL